jgi:hypothetical protein
MTGHTYLIIKASISFKGDVEKDKPYYKVADITPAGVPSTYREKWSPFIYEVIRVEHRTPKLVEPYIVKLESEDFLQSTVVIAAWASQHSTAQEKVVEVVNAAVAKAKSENQNVRPRWLYDQDQGFRGAVLQSTHGCVWVDVVAVRVQPMVNYGAVEGQVFSVDERSMGLGG